MGALHEEHKNDCQKECLLKNNRHHSSSNDRQCEEEKKSEDVSPVTNATHNNDGNQSLAAMLQTHIPNPSQQMSLLEQQQQQQQQQLLSPGLLQQQHILHNLIPLHLQNSMSLNIPGPGTTHNLIPPQLDVSLHSNLLPRSNDITPLLNPPYLCVQDRPDLPAVYNGVNPYYPGLRVVNQDPPIFAVDNFLTANECDFLIYAAQDAFGPAPVVGKGSGEVSSSRTSSTCYLAREDLPGYLRKVSLLTGKPPEHCELPQVSMVPYFLFIIKYKYIILYLTLLCNFILLYCTIYHYIKSHILKLNLIIFTIFFSTFSCGVGWTLFTITAIPSAF